MITVINGSPSKESKTMSLTKELIKGQKHKVFTPYNMNISSCDDCTYCHYKKDCVKQDDMNQIYDSLEDTNTLIISSPIYFGHFTDQTMKVINRFQKYFSLKWIQKVDETPSIKNLIIVSTAGHDESMFAGLHVTINILKKVFQSENVQTLYVSNSDDFDINNHLEKIKQIEKEAAF